LLGVATPHPVRDSLTMVEMWGEKNAQNKNRTIGLKGIRKIENDMHQTTRVTSGIAEWL
jgi:hypothetical protein